MPTSNHSILIARAAETLGGEDRLCFMLGVSRAEVHGWMDGGGAVPAAVFLKLIDLLGSAAAPTPAVQGSSHAFLDAGYAPPSRQALLEAALDAALAAAHTDLGNLQLMEEDGALHIAAQRGFSTPFLEFFAAVRKETESACGVALMAGRQFTVAEVETHPVFRGTAAGRAVLAADARAVASTPILGPSGALLGVLSVHFRSIGAPDDTVLAFLSRIARRTGAMLEPTTAAL